MINEFRTCPEELKVSCSQSLVSVVLLCDHQRSDFYTLMHYTLDFTWLVYPKYL